MTSWFKKAFGRCTICVKFLTKSEREHLEELKKDKEKYNRYILGKWGADKDDDQN